MSPFRTFIFHSVFLKHSIFHGLAALLTVLPAILLAQDEIDRADTLQAVDIVAKAKAISINPMNSIKTEMLGTRELAKAACCNLGESFETNPSVDVSFTDAATGARQIRLLGLAGPYTQLLTENLPLQQGLGRTYGLGFIPGPWVQSIQVSKGVGSVVQGYEALSGQVNVVLKKPDFEHIHLNGYVNNQGRVEGNFNYAVPVSSNVGTILMLHVDNTSRDVALQPMDRNKDGFSDQAMPTQFNVANQWQWRSNSGWQGEFGGQMLRETRLGGEMHYVERNRDPQYRGAYQLRVTTERAEAFNKTGYVWADKPYKSIGLQLGAVSHRTNGRYGIRTYDGRQETGYANLIYQSIIGNTNHTWRAGLSYRYDRFREVFRPADTLQIAPPAEDGPAGGRHGGHLNLPSGDPALNPIYLARDERVPGIFGEYTFTPNEQWTLLAGLRLDENNVFGTLLTPRLHLRYAPTLLTVLRFSAGRAYHAANILAENPSVLASSRQVVIRGPLAIEEAWNYGVNLTQQFRLNRRFGSFGVDVYRTDFVNQVVLNREITYRTAVFSNLDGRSFSNAIQLSAEYEAAKNLDVRVSYRYSDVQTTFGDQLLEQPLVARHRALLNLAYERGKWSYDATLQVYGSQRLINSATSADVRPDRSPSYALVHGQITRKIGKVDWYIGVENLLDFRQNDPLTTPRDPFGAYFDTAYTWGPVMGRTIYTGFRLSIPHKTI